jgi:hypothetical protein
MKHKFLLGFFLVLGCTSFGQQITFAYDPAGNQVAVNVEIQLASPNKMANTAVLQNNPIYKDVKYYPNPVKSELYMEWQTIDNNSVNHIIVFNTVGDLLKDYKDLNTVTNYTLSFGSYPQGIYFVQFVYSNGEQKTFKIIKEE